MKGDSQGSLSRSKDVVAQVGGKTGKHLKDDKTVNLWYVSIHRCSWLIGVNCYEISMKFPQFHNKCLKNADPTLNYIIQSQNYNICRYYKACITFSIHCDHQVLASSREQLLANSVKWIIYPKLSTSPKIMSTWNKK